MLHGAVSLSDVTGVALFAPGALVFAVLMALAVVFSSLYGWWIQRYESARTEARVESAVAIGQAYSILAVFFGLVWFGIPVAVRQPVASVSPFSPASFPATLTVTVVCLALIAVNAAAWYLPLAFAKVLAVDTDETVEELVRRAVVTVLFFGTVAFCPLGVALSPTLGLFDYPAAAAAAVAIHLLFSMEYYLRRKPRRPPSTAERERLEAAFAAAELDPWPIRILSMNPDEMIDIGYLGLADPHMVVVSDRVLSAVDDERLRILATLLDSLARTPFLVGRTIVLAGSALAAAWLLSPLAPASYAVRLLLLTGVCLVAAVLLWRLRVYVYRADSAAADRVGARTLLEHFEWWLEFSNDDSTHSRIWTVLLSQPPPDDRISRLREMAGEAQSPPADDPNPVD